MGAQLSLNFNRAAWILADRRRHSDLFAKEVDASGHVCSLAARAVLGHVLEGEAEKKLAAFLIAVTATSAHNRIGALRTYVDIAWGLLTKRKWVAAFGEALVKRRRRGG
jgi:hypothetical protein